MILFGRGLQKKKSFSFVNLGLFVALVKGREKERKKERKKDRQTDRQTDRERERERRKTEREERL